MLYSARHALLWALNFSPTLSFLRFPSIFQSVASQNRPTANCPDTQRSFPTVFFVWNTTSKLKRGRLRKKTLRHQHSHHRGRRERGSRRPKNFALWVLESIQEQKNTKHIQITNMKKIKKMLSKQKDRKGGLPHTERYKKGGLNKLTDGSGLGTGNEQTTLTTQHADQNSKGLNEKRKEGKRREKSGGETTGQLKNQPTKRRHTHPNTDNWKR